MVDRDALEKFKLLSAKEIEILKLVCEGFTYKEINKKTFISESSIKNHMGRVYLKFGIDQLPRRARAFALGNVYCEALREFETSSKGNDKNKQLRKSEQEAEPEPVSKKLLKIVEEDDGGPKVVYEGEVIVVDPDEGLIDDRGLIDDPLFRRKMNPFMMGFLIIAIISILFTGYSIYDRFFSTPPGQSTPSTEESSPEQDLSNAAAEAVPTKEIPIEVIPTETEVVPTESPTPEPTSPPKPAILFEDDFETALSDAWEIVSGNPIVVNGTLSADRDTWLLVGDPTWTNYSVEFQGESAKDHFYEGADIAALRVFDMDNMYAYKWVFVETEWYVVKNGEWNIVPQTYFLEQRKVKNFRFEVKANSIKVYVDGLIESSFFNDEFAKGRIGLFLSKNSIIDNFKVREVLD